MVGWRCHGEPLVGLWCFSPPQQDLHARANPSFANVDHSLCYPTDKGSTGFRHNHPAALAKLTIFSVNTHHPNFWRCSTACKGSSPQLSSTLSRSLKDHLWHRRTCCHCAEVNTSAFVCSCRCTTATHPTFTGEQGTHIAVRKPSMFLQITKPSSIKYQWSTPTLWRKMLPLSWNQEVREAKNPAASLDKAIPLKSLSWPWLHGFTLALYKLAVAAHVESLQVLVIVCSFRCLKQTITWNKVWQRKTEKGTSLQQGTGNPAVSISG